MWEVTYEPVTDEAHVTPLDDLIDHPHSSECVCGPTVEPVKRDDGSIGWVYTHHSLDGREPSEERSTANRL